MHKYVWRFVAVCICGCLLASVVRAKVWLLPDYQSSQFYSRRVNGGNNHKSDNPVCSDYGMYTASQITTGMSCASSAMIKNLKCYGDCSCSSVYQYTSSSCRSAGKIPSGAACMGKYRECICDTSTYPHTSSSCAYTLSGASCYDKYGYHYNSCVNPCAAYASYTNVSSCSYGCEDVVSTCTSKCRKCYADNCRNREDNETKLGCEKYWSDCPSKCQTGKTEAECDSGFHQSADKLSCVANACEGFTLSSCPTGAVSCETCKSGTTTKYKVSSCKDGYTQAGDTCTTADCEGFTLSSCPSHASCSTCKTGTAIKYKLDQCNSGYEISGSSCKAAACTGFSYSCISSATACETCQSGTTTKYRPTGCKEGYVLSSNTCSAVDCRSKGYTLYSCPSSALSCETCLGGASTYYKVNACKAGYEVADNTCAMVDCQGKGYTFYSCPSLAADCETCLRGSSTYYRIKNCQRPLSVSTDQKSCICPANAVVTDETSLRLAFSEKCPIITASGTINMVDTQHIIVYPNTTKFTGTNGASLHVSPQKYATIFKIEDSPETSFEISNLDFTVNSGGGLEVFQIWNRPTNISNIDVSLTGKFDMGSQIVTFFYSDAQINNLNIQADINTSGLFSPIDFYNPDDYSKSFSIQNSEIIVNNTGDGPVEALRFEMDDNSSSYINIESTKISLNTAERNYAIWVQETLTSGFIQLDVSGCSISAKSHFNAAFSAERNDFNSLTYINRAGEFSIVTQ